MAYFLIKNILTHLTTNVSYFLRCPCECLAEAEHVSRLEQ